MRHCEILCGVGVKKSNGWEFEIGDNRAKVVMCGGGTHVCHPDPLHHRLALSLIKQFNQNPWDQQFTVVPSRLAEKCESSISSAQSIAAADGGIGREKHRFCGLA